MNRRTVTGIVLAVELGSGCGAYWIWRKLKSDSDFRYTCYKNYRPVLLGFYEIYDSSKAVPAISLKKDTEIWKREGKPTVISVSHSVMEEEESTAVLMERKLKILHQKNEERKLRLEQRKVLKTKDCIAEENINSILIKFEQLNDDILSVLNQIEDINVPKESLPELFDSCYCKLEEWQKMISLSSHIMKIYHKKHLQDKYHELNDKRVKLEQSLLPEKKFSFNKLQKKDAKNETGDKEIGAKVMGDEVDAALCKAPKKFVYKFDDEFGLSEKEDESTSFSYEQLSMKDAVFRDLKNCRLTLEGGANTVHFVSLVDCRILCGPVSTSIFVEKCSDCTFVVACQQLRVHSTTDCDFYSHVTSRAIIEDCERVRFAPFNWKYEGIEEHFKSVNLSINENNWNLVNDFNWLSTVPSPNWKVIEEEDRVVEWN